MLGLIHGMCSTRSGSHIWLTGLFSCIDKSSSSELSEAINSMYRWYKEAACCYVYLSDVPSPPLQYQASQLSAGDAYMSDVSSPPLHCPAGEPPAYEVEPLAERLSGETLANFRASRWFKRGKQADCGKAQALRGDNVWV